MILDESLFEEVKVGDIRGSYKKKELSDEELFDKIFDKLQSKLSAKHYKGGVEDGNLYINARVINRKLPNGRVVIKKEFLNDKKDYEEVIAYLDEANVKHSFKNSIEGLQLNILLTPENAKEVNQGVLDRKVRFKKDELTEGSKIFLKDLEKSDEPRTFTHKNRFNYGIKQVRANPLSKKYSVGQFNIGDPKHATKNGKEFDRTINPLKDKGYTEELSKEEIKFGKSRWVKTKEDEKVWNSLSDEDKEFLVLSNDMGFWFDEIKGNEELKDKYEELKSKFSISLREGFAIIRTIEDAQREVDDDLEKFGRIGGGLYDDLDDAGFYVDENNKVQYKVKPVEEDLILDPTKEDKKLLNDLLDRYKGTEYEKVLDQLKSKYEFEDTFDGKNESLEEALNDIKEIRHKLDLFPGQITVNKELSNEVKDLLQSRNISFMIDDHMDINGKTGDRHTFFLKYPKNESFNDSPVARERTAEELLKLISDYSKEVEHFTKDNNFKEAQWYKGQIDWAINELSKKYDSMFKHIDESLKEDLSPEEQQGYGLNTLVNQLIKSEYDAIDEYNSAIVTLEAEGQGEYTDVIRSIIEDERHHIGNLQEVMNRITPGTEAEFEKGKEEAEQTLSEEPKEEIVNEALDSHITLEQAEQLYDKYSDAMDILQRN